MFSYNAALEGHAKRESAHSCMFCIKTFKKSSHLDAHLLSHFVRKRRHVCEVCHKELSSSSSLQYHLLFHSSAKPYFCNICNKAFRRTAMLMLHMRTHTGEKPHSCNTCKKSFAFQSSLKAHRFTHAKNKKPHLDKTFPRSRKSKENVRKRRLKCDKCDKTFLYKMQLAVHSANSCWSMGLEGAQMHAKEMKCENEEASKSSTAFRPRTLTDSNVADAKDAEKLFAHGAASKRSKSHPRKKTFSCFIPKKYLLNFCSQRNYVCNICKKEFKSVNGLKYHLLWHSRVKPYTCLFCKESFRVRSVLKLHMRIHAGERLYACDYCDRSFAHLGSYKIHKLQQCVSKRKNKPDLTKTSICGKCGKKFAFRGQLKHHFDNSCWGNVSLTTIK